MSTVHYKFSRWKVNRYFRNLYIMPFEPKEGHSVLLLINHFGWWEAYFSKIATVENLKRRWHAMMQHDQFEKHWYLRFAGSYAIKKGSRELLASLTYSAQLLEDPRNAVIICPQGEIRSNHETHIHVEKGVHKIIQQVKGPCQIVYQCTLLDFFEGYKLRAYVHQFDCGTTSENMTYDELKKRINDFHSQALLNQINMEH